MSKYILYALTVVFCTLFKSSNAQTQHEYDEITDPPITIIDTITFNGFIIIQQSKADYKNGKKSLYGSTVVVIDSSMNNGHTLAELDDLDCIANDARKPHYCISAYIYGSDLSLLNLILLYQHKQEFIPHKYTKHIFDEKYIIKKTRKSVYRKLLIQNIRAVRIKMNYSQLIYITGRNKNCFKNNVPMAVLLDINEESISVCQ